MFPAWLDKSAHPAVSNQCPALAQAPKAPKAPPTAQINAAFIKAKVIGGKTHKNSIAKALLSL